MDHLINHVSDRNRSLPRVEFPEIDRKIKSDKSIISLGPGEPDFLTPKPLLDYGKKVLKDATNYSEPSGMPELKREIVKKLKKDNRINVNEGNVLVSCGSQESLFAALLTLIDPKEEVIVPSPGYVGYIPAIDFVNGKPRLLELKEEDDWAINPDKLKKLVNKKTRALVINTPGNPTGNVFGKKILEEIADIVIDKDLIVLADEAYEKITYGKKHVSMGSLNGMKDHVITLQSFSKSFAMCGFRLGYAVAGKKIIEEMGKARFYITLSPPSISQLMGIQALKLNKRYVDAMVKEYKRRRDMIIPMLNEMGLETIMPEGAFYAFSKIPGKSRKFADKMIKKAKVAVIPGTEFGKYGEGYVRISFAQEYGLIQKALKRMEKIL